MTDEGEAMTNEERLAEIEAKCDRLPGRLTPTEEVRWLLEQVHDLTLELAAAQLRLADRDVLITQREALLDALGDSPRP